MPRRALHLAKCCLKMPGDASKGAENGSRFGSRSGALATLQRHSRCPDSAARSWHDVHHGHRGSIALAQESLGYGGLSETGGHDPTQAS
jgi:hypothetical protein